MTTTLELPDDVLRAVRLRAQRDGRGFSESVTDLLRDALALPSPPLPIDVLLPSPVMKINPVTGLPCFEGSPDAPAQRMTIAEPLALEQQSLYEEDLARL